MIDWIVFVSIYMVIVNFVVFSFRVNYDRGYVSMIINKLFRLMVINGGVFIFISCSIRYLLKLIKVCWLMDISLV